MLASRYADPDATPSPLSRKKRSRASNTLDANASDSPFPPDKHTSPTPPHTLTSANLAANETTTASLNSPSPGGDSRPRMLIHFGPKKDAKQPLPHPVEAAQSETPSHPTQLASPSPSPRLSPAELADKNGEHLMRNGEEHMQTGQQLMRDAEQAMKQGEQAMQTGVQSMAEVAENQPDRLVNASNMASPVRSLSQDGNARTTLPASNGVKKFRSSKGRTCAVRVPNDGSKTYSGSLNPLTRDETVQRIQAFQDAGYDTQGFASTGDAVDGDDVALEPSQARAIYPDQDEVREQHAHKHFAVSVPVKKDWDDYVEHLREEKLRQLGVSMGDELPPPPPLSRQATSPYLPLAFSPPPPGSSAASQHQWRNIVPFSTPFSPAASTNNTSTGHMASPGPFAHMDRPGHVSRQSTFQFQFPMNQFPGMSPGLVPQYEWLQQRDFTPEGVQRGSSSEQATGIQKPLPNLPREGADGQDFPSPKPLFDAQTDSTNAHDRSEGRTDPVTASAVAHATQAKTMQINDLASPKPQGHNHNISANLEREAENAQYYPGEYVEDEEEEDTSASGPSVQPDWNSLGAGRKAAVEQSAHNHQPAQSLTSNASIQLNVGAKEFKFDPHRSQAKNFSMSNDALMPLAPSKTARAADATSSVSFATAHSNQGSVSLSNFNVAAPEFKPPAQKGFAFSSNWFNFSKKPSEPINDAEQELPKHDEHVKSSDAASSKIFGGLAEIIKPGKKSRAIPIVNPDDIGVATTKDASDAEHEDEDGRPVRSDERRKRGRLADVNGDEAPRFAEPTPEPDTASRLAQAAIVGAKAKISREELERHMSEDFKLPTRRRLPQLEYDIDVDGSISDGSNNVPWHGVEDEVASIRRGSNGYDMDISLAASPAPSTAIDETFQRNSRTPTPRLEEKQSPRHLPYPTTEMEDNNEALFPTFKGADDIAAYINDDNSDFGVDDGRRSMMHTPHSKDGSRARSMSPQPPTARREVHSPSIDGFDQNAVPVSRRNYSDKWERRNPRDSVSPVRRLNTVADPPVSDWDDMLSSGAELKIPQQHQLNNAHMAGVIEGLLRRHLAPFERRLQDMSATLANSEARVTSSRSRPRSSYDKSNSDADEESEAEDDRAPRREVKSNRRMSQIRTAVQEAMSSAQSHGLGQIEYEAKYRKAAEQRAEDLQRLLTITEKEIALYKESTANQDDKIRSLEEDRDEAMQGYREVEEELRTKTLNFTSEAAKLENELDDYRTSSAKWQGEIDTVKHSRDTMQRTIETMKQDAAENVRERAELMLKVADSSKDLEAEKEESRAADNKWRDLNDERNRMLRKLQADAADAIRQKQELDADVQSLRHKEQEAARDAIRANVMLEETQSSKVGLEAQIKKLSDKAIEHSTILASYEREASEAHEQTGAEVQRIKALMATDIEIANKQVDNVRADLETRLEMTRSELENVRKDHDSVRGRYEQYLNESTVARKEAVQEANNNHTKRLKEERERFDQALKDLSTRHDGSLRSLHENRQRSDAHHASQLELSDSKVAHLDNKIAHLEERLLIAQSAAQAAAAAAQSANSAPSTLAVESDMAGSRRMNTPPHLDKVSPQALRESIVVLQEQLQDREARIERLEADAATETTEVGGTEGATKLQAKEAEVGWLREILGVRVDDLNELIKNLQMERFDRGAARNAAIRIKANLQMEEQERERQHDPSKKVAAAPSIPSLTDIQAFASPKAAQFAAAFGKWRSNPPTLAGMREQQAASSRARPSPGGRSGVTKTSIGQEMANGFGAQDGFRPKNAMAAAAASNASKASDADSFLSGLMTPPTSNLRRTPSHSATAKVSGPKLARPRTPSHSTSKQGRSSGSPERMNKDTSGPSTPELMRKGDYDLDAELGGQEIEEDIEDEDEHESPVKKQNKTAETADKTSLEPFGEIVANTG